VVGPRWVVTVDFGRNVVSDVARGGLRANAITRPSIPAVPVPLGEVTSRRNQVSHSHLDWLGSPVPLDAEARDAR